ncbi:hypothetical protein [Peribacillus muralis]|uniref:hypothetical protein n=1 Tax=Peribacillus muralis TaxID=264697 RepID=UPI0012EAAA80|nr:hypothetical protein [Peribacillus muralis]
MDGLSSRLVGLLPGWTDYPLDGTDYYWVGRIITGLDGLSPGWTNYPLGWSDYHRDGTNYHRDGRIIL